MPRTSSRPVLYRGGNLGDQQIGFRRAGGDERRACPAAERRAGPRAQQALRHVLRPKSAYFTYLWKSGVRRSWNARMPSFDSSVS